MTVAQFHREFRQHFPDLGNANQYLDPLMTTIAKQAILDPIQLDDRLQTPDGTSTRDYITARYGSAAAAWAERRMKPE